MPRSFDVTVESPARVDQVHRAFGEKDYWSARFARFGTATTLDSLTVGADGAVNIVTIQDLRHDALPQLVSRFYPGDLKVRGTETWQPGEGRQVHGRVAFEVEGAPGAGHGQALLVPRGSGSQLTFNGTIEFRVPMLGGAVERFLGALFAKHITDIQRFTTAWIADRA